MIAFHDEMESLVGEGRAMDAVYLRKTFDIVSF